jgi:hypothetical protein
MIWPSRFERNDLPLRTLRDWDPGMNAFATARIRAVAQTVGAPHDASSSWAPKVKEIFPQ